LVLHLSRAQSDSDSDSIEERGQQRGGKKRARSPSGPAGDRLRVHLEDEQHRKEKHKAVEQKRREKTKELLSTLQDLLPNLDETSPSALTMNTVLQCAIDYLTKNQDFIDGMVAGSAPDAAGDCIDPSLRVSPEDFVSLSEGRFLARAYVRCSHFAVETQERAYLSGFMVASMGIAYAGADGSIKQVVILLTACATSSCAHACPCPHACLLMRGAHSSLTCK
jgi:hypothetical protein